MGALNKGGDRLGALKLRAISAQGFGGGYLGLRGRAYLRAPRAEFLKIARPPKTALPRHVFKLQKSQSGAWRGGGAFGSPDKRFKLKSPDQRFKLKGSDLRFKLKSPDKRFKLKSPDQRFKLKSPDHSFKLKARPAF